MSRGRLLLTTHNPTLNGTRSGWAGSRAVPGDAATTMTVELITLIAMDQGQRFAIREGGRTVWVRAGFVKINK